MENRRFPFWVSLVTVVGFLIAPTGISAQSADDPASKVDELMAAYGPDGPGGVVAVVRGGEVVFAKGYGLAILEHSVPMTAETVLDIGSVAKQFTAFAIVLLEQDGKLSFDDDIRSHLPAIPDFGPTITIRHLVHHLSGLREIYNSKTLEGWQAGDGISQGDAQKLTARMRELNFEPGAQHLYCNTGYMLLADIVAEASGMPFPDFMRERVFGPLGMEHTTIMARLGQSIPGAAESYGRTTGGYVRIFDNSALFGAGGIYTTAGDLAKWMNNYSTGEVGGHEAIEQMQETGVLSSGAPLSYAFGLNIGESRGLRRIGHGGSSAGYRASFTYFPELDGGVITMSNLAQFDGSIPAGVAEAFFGDHMTPAPAPMAAPTGSPPGDAVEVDEELLERYVGEYELDVRPGFVLTMTREGTRLFGQATGQGRNPFTATSDSTFALGTIASITFHREADGSVQLMTLHQGGDLVARRRVRWSPTAAELAELVGAYFSPELETLYTLVVEDGKLIAKHRRHDDFELIPDSEDSYRATAVFGTVAVERDALGEVEGLRVSNGRVLNMWFERMRD